ncbi:MAG: DUF1570 domain-containing protein [Planctomycetes bacterium]|nr:DUF1570 domain-containing protein [Planctomycetota bacterium]
MNPSGAQTDPNAGLPSVGSPSVGSPKSKIQAPRPSSRTASGRLRTGSGRVPQRRSGRLRSSGVRRIADLEDSDLPPRRATSNSSYLVITGAGLCALFLAGIGATLLFMRKAPEVAQGASPTPTATATEPEVESPADRFRTLALEEIGRADEDAAQKQFEQARRRLLRLEATLRSEPGSDEARRLLLRRLASLPKPRLKRAPPPRNDPTDDPDFDPILEIDPPTPRTSDPPTEDPSDEDDEDPLAPDEGDEDPLAPYEEDEAPIAPDEITPPSKAGVELTPSPKSGGTSKRGGVKPDAATGGGSHLATAYKTRKSKLRAGSGPREYLSLARWARSKGLYEEEKEALTLATLADPDHRGAKTQLRKVLDREAHHRKYRTPWRREASVVFVETNTSEAKLHYYCDTVSAFYKRFSKIFRVRRDPVKAWGRKVGVRVFRTREDFDRYARETGTGISSGVVGYYRLDVKEIVLYYDPNAPESTLDTLFHEGTHLFCHLALGEQFYKLPHWVSEGIAEYFAPSQLDRNKKDLRHGLPAYDRLRYARRILKGQRPSLRGDLLGVTDYGSFGAARYSLAWTLVHMLLEKPKLGSKRPKYRERFLRYWSAVTAGEDSVKAFEKIIGPIDRIEEEWYTYIEEFQVPAIEEAIALVRKADYEGAIPVLKRYLIGKPKDAQGHYLLGDVYLRLDRYAESRLSFEAAIRINPEFVDALAGLTFVYAYLEEGALGVKTGQRAVSISPNVLTYFALATAALAAKDKKIGLVAIDAAIDRAGASSTLLTLRRELKALP